MPGKGYSFGKKKRHAKPRGRHAKASEPDSNSCPSPDVVDQPEEMSLPPVGEDNGTTTDIFETSCAERKFEHFSSSFEDDASSAFNGIFHSSFISSLLDFVVCPSCSTTSLNIELREQKGLASSYGLYCSVCDKTVWSAWKSPRNSSGHFDINVRTVLGCKEAGIAHAKLSTLFGIMSIPTPLHHKTYQDISKVVHHATVFAAEDSMKKAAEVAQQRSLCQGSDRTSSSGCPVITVSYDGTWHKRGHSSHTGVGVAIDFESGLVLDTQIVSNFCAACARGPKKDSAEYQVWWPKHKLKCMKNFDGSSNAMEAEAASFIFSRSIRKRELVYGTMLCDGDSKAFNEANRSANYDIPILKEDCINHIAKRMFNALDTLKKTHKAELSRKLTQPNIEKITNVYAKSLKDNAPDVEKMKKGVLGSFLHMASTDEKPNHRLCPEGETSWCHYNRALATNTPIRPHTPTIKPEVSVLVYPIFKRLSDPELLSRCAKMGTQNANESFNSLIWRRCPKTDFCSKSAVETATFLSVLAFNTGKIGIKFVMDKLEVPWTITTRDFCITKQRDIIRKARKRALGISKWKRKNMKKRRIEEDHQRQQKEGTTYESGGFNN